MLSSDSPAQKVEGAMTSMVFAVSHSPTGGRFDEASTAQPNKPVARKALPRPGLERTSTDPTRATKITVIFPTHWSVDTRAYYPAADSLTPRRGGILEGGRERVRRRGGEPRITVGPDRCVKEFRRSVPSTRNGDAKVAAWAALRPRCGVSTSGGGRARTGPSVVRRDHLGGRRERRGLP